MIINWPLITVLFCLSIPGVVIAIKRLIYFLLPDNSEELKRKVCRFAILQTLVMVFILTFAGAVISKYTGLRATVLDTLLEGKAGISDLAPIVFLSLGYAFFGLIIFLSLYYGVARRLIDENNLQIMRQLRLVLGVDGCILYGGVVEEIIGRWGIMNLAVFFALLFTKHSNALIMWTSIAVSGLIFAVGQLPAYLAAGCTAKRGFIYTFILLSLYQSMLFGYLFWQYDLVCAILTHMLFHLGWALYEHRFNRANTPPTSST